MGLLDFFNPRIEKMEEKRDIRGLMEVLKKFKPYHIRKKAVEALGKIGNKRATEPLISALKNGSEYVREEAANALGNLGDKRAVEYLINGLRDSSEYVREAAGEALVKIEDNRSVGTLIQALKDENEF